MPSERLDLQIPEGLSQDELLTALQASSELEEFLVGNVSRFDSRADYDDSSFTIDEIESDSANTYVISYSFKWAAYYGCSDMSPCGIEEESARFTYENGVAVFEIDWPEPPSPGEEL
ncbi:MAG TPA: hypothetical protein PLN52_08410 [Opitutaceae bacterium]|nr:hypothetical protein [Opitutaceae bacterium]